MRIKLVFTLFLLDLFYNLLVQRTVFVPTSYPSAEPFINGKSQRKRVKNNSFLESYR